jgi:hypothetical protein
MSIEIKNFLVQLEALEGKAFAKDYEVSKPALWKMLKDIPVEAFPVNIDNIEGRPSNPYSANMALQHFFNNCDFELRCSLSTLKSYLEPTTTWTGKSQNNEINMWADVFPEAKWPQQKKEYLRCCKGTLDIIEPMLPTLIAPGDLESARQHMEVFRRHIADCEKLFDVIVDFRAARMASLAATKAPYAGPEP